MKKADKEKLRMWQERLSTNETAYEAELKKMDGREALYMGKRELRTVAEGDERKKAGHVRNICAELVEAQVDSNIPQPKVTARRAGDELKAKLIEDMLRNELDRMPFEQLNDLMERTVPIQGGAAFLVEWDNRKRTHYTIGELSVSALHPKQIIPQAGIYSGVENMDYIILKIPQSKQAIREKYGVDVSDETEREPEIKSARGETADDMVTQYVAYYRNEKGGIGLYSWVNDVALEDLEDYQARRLCRCAQCGAVEPLENVEPAPEPGVLPNGMPGPWAFGRMFPGAVGKHEGAGGLETRPYEKAGGVGGKSESGQFREETPARNRKRCVYCGGTKWEESAEDYEELYFPVARSNGSMIPGLQSVSKASETVLDEMGLPVVETVQEPTRIPFYKPNIFPVLLQKNVSVYGKFLGDSDLDKIEDQQNTINHLEGAIIDKLLKGGSFITLPDDARIAVNGKQLKVIYPGNQANKAMIDVYTLQGDISADMAYLSTVYEEARQIIGITDSFQGRKDATATSGKAKEFSAAQSAGRLESKRVMKQAAYAALFEAMFKFKLAYADEPRPVVSNNLHGNKEYKEFNRYDFLEQDAAGEWCWNDQFLFSCDTSAPLASNREAMWQETRMNLQTGAFGDPASLQTLILFWTKMEMLCYPGAGETRRYLEEELEKQAQQAAMMGAPTGKPSSAPLSGDGNGMVEMTDAGSIA